METNKQEYIEIHWTYSVVFCLWICSTSRIIRRMGHYVFDECEHVAGRENGISIKWCHWVCNTKTLGPPKAGHQNKRETLLWWRRWRRRALPSWRGRRTRRSIYGAGGTYRWMFDFPVLRCYRSKPDGICTQDVWNDEEVQSKLVRPYGPQQYFPNILNIILKRM